jgi:hypothetical protein
MDILIVHLLSITPMPCPLALSNQGATMICWMQSSIFLKPRIYYQLGIHANQKLNPLSLPSFSSNVILSRNWMQEEETNLLTSSSSSSFTPFRPSTTLPMSCPLALGCWEEWRIWRSHVTVKPYVTKKPTTSPRITPRCLNANDREPVIHAQVVFPLVPLRTRRQT